jgi:hypothetical protein
MNYFGRIIHRFYPSFAVLASLRGIFRGSLATRPREVLGGETLRRIKYQQRETPHECSDAAVC